MIRLDDSGTRISVRFADTTEQRELRVSNPIAMSIVIEGLHVRTFASIVTSSPLLMCRSLTYYWQRTERTSRDGEQSPGRLSMAQAALLNMKGNQVHPSQLSPLISPELGNLSSSAVISPLLSGHLSPPVGGARTPLSPMSFQQQQTLLQQRIHDLSLTTHGYDAFSLNASPYLCPDLIAPQLAQVQEELRSLQEAQAHLQLRQLGAAGGMGSAARADSGFTPMERMLLQAHVQRQQEQQLLDAQIHAQAQQGLACRGQGKRRLLDALPVASIEDDFHASTSVLNTNGTYLSPQPGVGHVGAGLAQRQRNQTHGSNARVADVPHAELGQALHLRSTTMPSQYLSSRSLDRNRGVASNGVVDRSPTITTTAGNNAFSVASNSNSNAFARKPSLPTIHGLGSSTLPRIASSTTAQGHGQGLGRGVIREVDAGADEDGPGLTFSPRTPATLSPPTPFGGFFHSGESFDGSGMVGAGEKGVSMAHHDASTHRKGGTAVGGGVNLRGLHV